MNLNLTDLTANTPLTQIIPLLYATGKKQQELFEAARSAKERYFGNRCLIRAVAEVSNHCENSCGYCSIGMKNNGTSKYIMRSSDSRATLDLLQKTGIRTLMLQGGESKESYHAISDIIPLLRESAPLELIGCFGALDGIQIRRLKKLGMKGYILKFETLNKSLHYRLRRRTLGHRLQSLQALLNAGFRCGSGVIAGLPGQHDSDLAESLRFMRMLKLPLNSVSPFIPSAGSRLSGSAPATLELCLNYIALLRLVNPASMIPAVSALNLLHPEGQLRGLRAGACNLTVNFTPGRFREQYDIYDRKRYVSSMEKSLVTIEKAGMIPDTSTSLGREDEPGEMKQRIEFLENYIRLCTKTNHSS